MAGGKLRAVLELVRPHNLVVAALTALVGYGAAAKAAGGDIIGLPYAVLASIVVLVAAGGYVINDYYDVLTDSVAKPWRPIPRGDISRREARWLAIALLAAGVFVAFASSPLVGVFAAISAVSLHEYSRWVKHTGLAGNVLVALDSAASILFGGFFYDALRGLQIPLIVFVPTAYAFLLSLGREIIKGIEDVEGDARAGIYTLAVRLGPRRAAFVASVLLLLVVALSPLPWLTGLYNVVYMALALVVDGLIAATLVLLHKSQAALIDASRRARSLLKWAFAVGGLAFLLGLI